MDNHPIRRSYRGASMKRDDVQYDAKGKKKQLINAIIKK